MAPKKALIIGVTGQDGAYLASLLKTKDYDVYGAAEDLSKPSLARLDLLGISEKVRLVKLNLKDDGEVKKILHDVRPDEIYNLAAQSSIAASIEDPLGTAEITGLGLVRLLEAVRHFPQPAKLFQASTSEILDWPQFNPNTEEFPSLSPYASSKLFAHSMAHFYREKFGVFVSCAIMYNHESPLRAPNFVSRKIADGVVKIKKGRLDILELGQLDSQRDWGYAPEFVEGMWRMLQQKKPDDFVLATGEAHRVREFVEAAFACVGIDLVWEGKNINETGRDKKTGRVVVQIRPEFFRDVQEFQKGDYSKAKKILDWEPRTTFHDLVRIMVDAELKKANTDSSLGR